MYFLKKYGTAVTIRFSLRLPDGSLATGSDWTPVSGDVQITLDGGALASTTNLPSYSSGQWALALTTAELEAADIAILVEDDAIVSEAIKIETYGHASATFPQDYSLTHIGIDAKITTDHGAGTYTDSGTAVNVTAVNGVATSGVADFHADTSALLTEADYLASLPTNFSDLDVDVSGAVATQSSGGGTVDANIVSVNGVGTTGVADFHADTSALLTEADYLASLPANFTDLDITVAGAVAIQTTGGIAANVTAVKGVPVTDINDFHADTSALLTETDYLASLPTNFEDLAIAPTTGLVTVDGVNVTQVNGVATTGVADFHADISTLLTTSTFTSALPANFSDLAITASEGKVTTANPGTDVNVVAVNGTPTANINDFKADTTALLTESAFLAELPTNLDLMAINGSGQVVSSNVSADTVSALTTYTAAKTGDLSNLLTQSQFTAALPANFEDLAITVSDGYVTPASNDANIVSVNGTPTTDISDFHTDISTLLDETTFLNALPTNFSDLSVAPTTGFVTADNALLDTTAFESSVEAALTSYTAPTLTQLQSQFTDLVANEFPANFELLDINGAGAVTPMSNDANVISVNGTPTASINDFHADTSTLLDATAFTAALPTNFGDLAITPTDGKVTVDGLSQDVNIVSVNGTPTTSINDFHTDISSLLDETTFLAQLPANFAAQQITGLGHAQTEVVRVGSTPVTGPDDLKADISQLLDEATFLNALPTNFDSLDINGSGQVTTSNPGGLDSNQQAQLDDIQLNTSRIESYPSLTADRGSIIGTRFDLVLGTDYTQALGNPIILHDLLSQVLPPDSTPLRLQLRHRQYPDKYMDVTGASTTDGSGLVAQFDVLASDTATLAPGPHDYYVYELDSGQWRLLHVRGQAHVDRGILSVS